MFARLYMGIILSLSLLGGALAAAPAVSADHHAVTAAAAFAGAGEPLVAGSDGVDVGEANDHPPLLAEAAAADASPLWHAAWKPARPAAVVAVALFLPDEPPKHLA